MKTTRRLFASATAVALALLLGACGSDPVTPPTPPPPSPTPRPPVVIDAGEGSLPAFVVLLRPLTTTETGSFEIIVDWTFATNDIDILLARGDCSFDQFVGGGCNYAATATSPTTKPERLTLANQPAGTYTLIVPNFGPEDESISYQVIFTPGTSAAAASNRSVVVSPEKVRQLRRGIVK